MKSVLKETLSPFPGERVWLHRFALLTSVATWVLIWAGGLVTSTDSGLAVPDWPLSYGMLMPPMVGGILYEHGHRLVATSVGCLTMGLAAWLWRTERRRWLRNLGPTALALVIAQGVLGGITVLYFLPRPVSVAHATLAQTFFCVTVLIAFATSREWLGAPNDTHESSLGPLRRAAILTTACVYGQLILGAVVRHTGAALAIPDFPLALGRLIPPLTNGLVAIHFAHRVGALAIVIVTALLARRAWRDERFSRPVALLCGLVALQIGLGGLSVWTETAVLPTTAHVATGALVLATSWFITLRTLLYSRHEPSPGGAPIPAVTGA